jgi:hypothetical protein
MLDWIKTAQGVAAIVAAVFAIMVAWWNLGTGMVDVTPGVPWAAVGGGWRDPAIDESIGGGLCLRSDRPVVSGMNSFKRVPAAGRDVERNHSRCGAASRL